MRSPCMARACPSHRVREPLQRQAEQVSGRQCRVLGAPRRAGVFPGRVQHDQAVPAIVTACISLQETRHVPSATAQSWRLLTAEMGAAAGTSARMTLYKTVHPRNAGQKMCADAPQGVGSIVPGMSGRSRVMSDMKSDDRGGTTTCTCTRERAVNT